MKVFREEYTTGLDSMLALPDNIRILKRNLMAASWVSILSALGVIEIAQGTQIVSGLAIKEGAIPWVLLAVVVYLAISYFTLFSIEYIKPENFKTIHKIVDAFGAKEPPTSSDHAKKDIRQYYGKLSRFKTQWLNKHIPIGLSLIAIGCLVSEILYSYIYKLPPI